MTDYDDYYDAAKKDGEPVIQGEHGGSIYPPQQEADDYPPSYGDRDYLGPVGWRP